MTERAIDKMVEWLEKEPNFLYTDYKDIRTAKMYKECIDKARRLALEEAKEKPVAPASLVEIWGEIYQRLLNGDVSYKELEAIRRVMDEIFSRYSPSPQADIVGHDKPSIPTDKTTGVDQMKFKAE